MPNDGAIPVDGGLTEQHVIRLAVVDDHALFLGGLQHILKLAPIALDVRRFLSGLHLIADLDAGETFDVVVSDLSMRDINGLGLIRAIRSRGCAAPVIILTASEDSLSRANAERAGAFAFLHKSVDEKHLFAVISEAVDAGPLSTLAVQASQIDSHVDEDGTEFVVFPTLSPRQIDVLRMISEGATNLEIAETLAISANTVKTHVQAIFRELGVRTRTAAVQKARSLALI